MPDRPVPPPSSLRLLVFGMACPASAPPLAALLRAGFAVEALVLPGGEGGPLLSDPERLARAAGVPVLRAHPADPPLLDLAARVDALVVACFPFKLPPALLARPRLGGLNVHPSLLPLGRGPEPVFWTLRRGERRTGATVHLLDDGFDTGPILAQRGVALPVGVRAPELEHALMALGGELLVDLLPRWADGEIVAVPQDDALATRAPVPSPADWLMPTTLPAGWAFAFARGVAPLGGPLAVQGPFGVLPVRDALAHHPTARPREALAELPDGRIRGRYSPGWVEFATGREGDRVMG